MERVSTSKDRLNWIDIAKGLGILFVMIGHSRLSIGTAIVYYFHMPLFFFLSGYVFSGEKYDSKTFIKNRAKRLMVPYYVYGFIMLICKVIDMAGWFDFDLSRVDSGTVMDNVVRYVIQERFGTLWYITSIFFMTIVFYFLLKWFKGDIRKVNIASGVMLIIGLIYVLLGGGWLPFNIDIYFTMMIFYSAGYSCSTADFFESERFTGRMVMWGIIATVVCLVSGTANLFMAGGKVDIYYNDFRIIPLTYISSFAGIIAIVVLSKKMNSRFFSYIGRNSFMYYALHQCLVFPFVQALMRHIGWFSGNSYPDKVVQSLLCIGLSFAILTIPTELLKKTKAGWVFGL